MTLVWVAILILAYFVFAKSYDNQKVQEYINNLNDAQQAFNFDLASAVLSHDFVMDALGFSDQPKDFSKWDKSSKDKWYKELEKLGIEQKLYFRTSYFPIGDFFITLAKGGNNTYPVQSEFKKRTIYSSDLLKIDGEEEDYSKDRKDIDLTVVERFVSDKRIRIITGYLKYKKGFIDTEPKVDVLFNFPYQLGIGDEVVESYGFSIDRTHSDPYPSDLQDGTDTLSNMEMWTIVDYKNDKKVKISQIFT